MTAGLGGCQEGSWRSSLNEAPLFCFIPPIIFLCCCRGRDQIPGGRGVSPSVSPDGDPPRQTPLGSQPMDGPGCSAATGLSPAPPPGKPKHVQDFPPKIDLSFSVFSFFLPLSLLCCHPVSPPPPPPCWRVCRKPEVSPSAAPFEMSDPRGFVLSRDEKVPNAALNGSR